ERLHEPPGAGGVRGGDVEAGHGGGVPEDGEGGDPPGVPEQRAQDGGHVAPGDDAGQGDRGEGLGGGEGDAIGHGREKGSEEKRGGPPTAVDTGAGPRLPKSSNRSAVR